ncbi:MAG: autotransporter outer membrane beta-barrel domain-containing protein [Deltaproteobacteria bacterium]|nr:autotransporter outer membrane beta-barrel domain-containing protein [Deltaproteobacteria bacterium]
MILNSGVVGSGNTGSIAGGVSASSAGGSGDANKNTVMVNGGSVTKEVIGGLSSGGAAKENTVIINGGDIGTAGYAVYGGLASKTTSTGEAAGNIVEVRGGTLYDRIYGGTSVKGDAVRNRVIVTKGTVKQSIFGGQSQAANGKADYNTVIIEAGAIGSGKAGEGIAGGFLDNAAAAGTANHNTVVLRGAPAINETFISGGYTSGTGTPNLITGNTLVFDNYTGTGTTAGSKLGKINNFEKFEFILAKEVKNGDVVIRATDLTLGTGSVSAKILGLRFANSDSVTIHPGESFTLIQADNNITGDVSTNHNKVSGYQGTLLRYDLELAKDAKNLVVKVKAAALDEKSKVLSEAFFGGAGILIDGFDFVTSEIFDGSLGVVGSPGGISSGARYDVFGAFNGGKTRYETGSHVDVKGFSGIIGISSKVELESADLFLGAFLEAGTGTYDTFNSFANYADVAGTGDVDYGGAGALAKLNFHGSPRGNFHMEFLGRMGKIKNSFDSSGFAGGLYDYQIKSDYRGLHLGLGYLFNFRNAILLDLYAKYFWTWQEGGSVRLQGGDKVTFDDVNSHRARGGLRLTFNSSAKVKPYVGAGYEREFDGKVGAKAYGFNIEEVDPSGGSFTGELGINVAASEGVALNVGVQGYLGAREGVTGGVGLKVIF